MLLIFDLDGTLIDSRACICKATQEAFKFSGFSIPDENLITAAMGIPIEVTFPLWSGQSDCADLMAKYRSLYAEFSRTELTVFEGIPRTLSILAKNHTLAIATSKKHSVAESSLEIFGLREYFSYVIGSDDVQNYKPHPESIYKILSKFSGGTIDGSKKHYIEAWMIGDATTDIDMGEAADVCTCFVTWGAHSVNDQGDRHPPTSLLHHPTELLWLFGEHSSRLFLDDLVIRPWSTDDSIERITELLHAAYKALADQGMHYNASHQPPEQTLARLERGTSFLAVEKCSNTGEENIIGTISLYNPKGDSDHPYYQREGLVYFGQFGVDPAYQGYGVARRLYQTVEDYARNLGAKEIALDTAEIAHELITTYRRWGFEIVDDADWDSTNYRSVIMSKSLT